MTLEEFLIRAARRGGRIFAIGEPESLGGESHQTVTRPEPGDKAGNVDQPDGERRPEVSGKEQLRVPKLDAGGLGRQLTAGPGPHLRPGEPGKSRSRDSRERPALSDAQDITSREQDGGAS